MKLNENQVIMPESSYVLFDNNEEGIIVTHINCIKNQDQVHLIFYNHQEQIFEFKTKKLIFDAGNLENKIFFRFFDGQKLVIEIFNPRKILNEDLEKYMKSIII